MLRWRFDAAITWARYVGAQMRTRGQDDGLIARYRCTLAGQVFYIVGAGGTVNDLSEADCLRIEAGTSASINMACVAPVAFDICSVELIADQHQADSLAAKLSAQAKPAVIWFQKRSRHQNAHIAALERRFPMHSYRRASVSVRRRLDTFRYIFRTVMRRRVFDAPDLNVTFALTGTVARLVLLACSLGYRDICFVGVDLGSTPYFWQENRALRGVAPWRDVNGSFDPRPTTANFQGGSRVVPTLFDFLRALHEDSGVALRFSTIDPAGRSRLTGFLRDELYAGPGSSDQKL